MINPHDYSISVRRGDFDGEICFEARIKEFPDITEYADSFEEAYALAIDSIEATLEIFEEKQRVIPSPIIPADDYSGRVTLRLSKSLHRILATMSDTEGVSLNQYICNILSYYSGFANVPVGRHSTESWSSIEQTIQDEKTSPHLTVVKTESSLRKELKWQKTG